MGALMLQGLLVLAAILLHYCHWYRRTSYYLHVT
jgi:hypothetical protein